MLPLWLDAHLQTGTLHKALEVMEGLGLFSAHLDLFTPRDDILIIRIHRGLQSLLAIAHADHGFHELVGVPDGCVATLASVEDHAGHGYPTSSSAKF